MKDALFGTVRGEISRIEAGDVLGVKSLCGQFERFVKADGAWSSMAKAKDGFFGSEINASIVQEKISRPVRHEKSVTFVDEKVFQRTRKIGRDHSCG